jgi:hypothetical protein
VLGWARILSIEKRKRQDPFNGTTQRKESSASLSFSSRRTFIQRESKSQHGPLRSRAMPNNNDNLTEKVEIILKYHMNPDLKKWGSSRILHNLLTEEDRG